MRRFGVIPYMTPLQRATESSTVPKSVMKTTVGGDLDAGCSADRKLARRRSAANPLKSLRADRRRCGSTKNIDRNTPKRLLVYWRFDRAQPARLTTSAIVWKNLSIVSGRELEAQTASRAGASSSENYRVARDGLSASIIAAVQTSQFQEGAS